MIDSGVCANYIGLPRCSLLASLRPGLRSATRLYASGPRAVLVCSSATSRRFPNITARFRERVIILQFLSLHRHRSRNVGHGSGFFVSEISTATFPAVSSSTSPTPVPPKCSAIIRRRQPSRRVPPRSGLSSLFATHSKYQKAATAPERRAR